MDITTESDLVKKIVRSEWTQILVIAITVSGLFLWNHSEIRSNQRETRALIEVINKEIRDFHGRLEKQDAEFKAGLLLIEERMKSK